MRTLIIIILFSQCFAVFSQDTMNDYRLFPYNTCQSPCWMGLTAGVSTSLDVDAMIEAHDDIITLGEYGKNISRLPTGEWAIDEETEVIQMGGYIFTALTPFSPFESYYEPSNYINIQDGVIYLIKVYSTEEYPITLSTILEKLGEPDYVRIYSSDDLDTFEFRLMYVDTLISMNLYQSLDTCKTDKLLDNFMLLNIFYNSEASANEAIPSVNPDILQPRLLTYRWDSERDVPLETWEQWVTGDIAESCIEAWEKLTPPDLEAIEIMPTATVEPKS